MMALDEKMLKQIKEARVDDIFNVFFDDAFQKLLYVDLLLWHDSQKTCFLIKVPYSERACCYVNPIWHNKNTSMEYFKFTAQTSIPCCYNDTIRFVDLDGMTTNALKMSFASKVIENVSNSPYKFTLCNGKGEWEIDIPNLDALLIMADLKSTWK